MSQNIIVKSNDYANPDVNNMLENEVEFEDVCKFVDDDRENFCGNNNKLAFLWAMTNYHGLTGEVSQMMEGVGCTIDSIPEVKMTFSKKDGIDSSYIG